MSGQATRQDHPGDEIRARREAIKLSREGLAYKSGVALKTIERIERGENEPRRATLSVIQDALHAAERKAA